MNGGLETSAMTMEPRANEYLSNRFDMRPNSLPTLRDWPSSYPRRSLTLYFVHDGCLCCCSNGSLDAVDVVLEADVRLQSHVVIDGKTRVGSGTVIHPFASLGGEPQDKKHRMFADKESREETLTVGSNCVIREHVTVHGSTSYSEAPTSVGDDCWLLCGAHVAHDSQLGRRVVVSNNVCIAGHVSIGDGAIIGGQVGIKQHVSVGPLAMVGGQSAVDGDVLPYGLVVGNRAKLAGLNLVGLQRCWHLSIPCLDLQLPTVQSWDVSFYRQVCFVLALRLSATPDLDTNLTNQPAMRKNELKLDNPAHDTKTISSKRSPKNRAKERPRKSFMRQHRRASLQAELNDEQQSSQAESPLLQPDDSTPQQSDTPTATKKREKTSRRAGRLPSASQHRPKHNTEDNSGRVDGQHIEQNTIPTARRSSILSWRSRNSTASLVENAPPSSCPLSCQPSACFIGSLNGTISEMHLPLLSKQTKARLNALKAQPNRRQLEITIERSDELPFGAYSHPQVRIHILDRCTGRSLCPPQMTSEGKFWTGLNNNDDWTSKLHAHVDRISFYLLMCGCVMVDTFEWQQALGISVDMPTFLSARMTLLFEILEAKRPTKETRIQRGKRFKLVSTHDEDGDFHKTPPSLSMLEYRRIAWGFFHTITNKGNPTMNSFVLPHVPESSDPEKLYPPNIGDSCGLRVRLFEYQVLTWLDKYQAKLQWGWRKNHPTMPAVFLQYQKRNRVPAPSTLHVQLRAVASAVSPRLAATPEVSATPSMAEATDKGEQEEDIESGNPENGNQDNQEPPTSAFPVNGDAQAMANLASPNCAPADLFDLLAPCKRHTSEPCLIPQRVLCSLATGKRGCSAISFSPCGRYLAAGVSPELGEFVVRVYDVASGELFAVGRGHRGIIYTLEWSTHAGGKPRVLSASSDGTIRLWETPSTNASSPPASPRVSSSRRSRLLSLIFQWHHFPCFVYCATFLPDSKGNVVLTGASDGCVRFRKESSVPNGQPEYGTLQVSSVAIHTICAEAKMGRVFCGDAKGDITVWKRSSRASTLCEYDRIKTISTGQTSITSLNLHPRKPHLLVHTQPNAIFQYELRSYLLLNKSYAGVACESLLVKSAFSPDGKLVISGSEDGVPRLFTSLHGHQLQRGVWGTHFFHGCPVLDVSWSSTAHMAALCSYDDKDSTFVDDSATSSASHSTISLQQLAVDAFRSANQEEAPTGDHSQRLQRALERRQKRLQAKVNSCLEVCVVFSCCLCICAD
ncbi:unnamed protein product [Phytophthora lilii]|uniref:Unnamed protein product n=1 Tax=Phytophthora lilii TaxID=2077276 RepID=A0A9W6TFL9_9STRA|nr:unnamed protein product [Phytophthora lilii]